MCNITFMVSATTGTGEKEELISSASKMNKICKNGGFYLFFKGLVATRKCYQY